MKSAEERLHNVLDIIEGPMLETCLKPEEDEAWVDAYVAGFDLITNYLSELRNRLLDAAMGIDREG